VRGAVLSSLPEGGAALLRVFTADARSRTDGAVTEFLLDLTTMIGVQGLIEQEIYPTVEYIAEAGLAPRMAFQLLGAFGEGLRRDQSSLAFVDKEARLVPFYSQALQTAQNPNAPEGMRLDAFQLLNVSPYTLDNTADTFLLMLGS